MKIKELRNIMLTNRAIDISGFGSAEAERYARDFDLKCIAVCRWSENFTTIAGKISGALFEDKYGILSCVINTDPFEPNACMDALINAGILA